MFQHTAAQRRLRENHHQRAPYARFNTQPRRGGCLCTMVWLCFSITCFNTQPRRGGCSACNAATCSTGTFQHTAAQRRLLIVTRCRLLCGQSFQHTAARRRLPIVSTYNIGQDGSFNTQPHEGGCPVIEATSAQLTFVSTHSRTKAAALSTMKGTDVLRPVSTHSRTKAAASASGPSSWSAFGFQHTAARRRLLTN